jgi:dipeptidase E
LRALLLSNSTEFGRGYLDHALEALLEFLGGRRRLAFVPFALRDRPAYTEKVRARLSAVGLEVEGVTAGPAGMETVEAADAVFVGGGNTFRLLNALQRTGLLEVLKRRALDGMPYVGASAGTNLASPTIRTTNDMPIVEPRSLRALGLVPFQINPHYLDPDPNSRQTGETREDRLREYLEENEAPVVALRDGAWLRLEGDGLRLGGRSGARVFRRGREPEEVAPGAALEGLWFGATPPP